MIEGESDAGRLDDSHHWVQNVGLVSLHDLPVHHHFVNNEVSLFNVEHDIEFANVLEVLVQGLHHVVDELEETELIHVVVHINANDEVQRRIPPVNYFVLSMLKERTLVLGSGQALPDKFSLQSNALLHRKTIVVLR